MATLSSSLLSSSPLCKSRFSPSRTDFISFSPRRTLSAVSPAIVSFSVKHHRCRNSFQVRSVASPAETASEFDEMVSGTKRKYYMLGGKGGVGKTSCAASLAVRFANNGHPTLVVSTDPAHSLSDSFAQVKEVTLNWFD
ncbi:hypothetical protein DY000_02037170 [Brassica cretica]|uniref:ArsA/GET3 Anion-transporting ATPase-like domain-containing protein n=1 Tax=Brassica cretica TaxID=69181 RepID=A0ABQ7BPC5_BRACR|nr:hypothetical protein DY000_02037170 [Brassica cretica]